MGKFSRKSVAYAPWRVSKPNSILVYNLGILLKMSSTWRGTEVVKTEPTESETTETDPTEAEEEVLDELVEDIESVEEEEIPLTTEEYIQVLVQKARSAVRLPCQIDLLRRFVGSK